MDCRLTGRHVKVTDELRDLVARRLTPVERLLGDTVVSADMVLSSERNHYQTEFVAAVQNRCRERGRTWRPHRTRRHPETDPGAQLLVNGAAR